MRSVPRENPRSGTDGFSTFTTLIDPTAVESEFSNRLRLQRLLVELSSRFVGLPSPQVDAAIGGALRLIVETLGLDRSTLWQIPESGSGMVLTHCWQRPGWPPLPPAFPADRLLPWAFSTVMRGETIRFSRISDLPPEAETDARAFRVHGPKSNLTVPLVTNGRTYAALAFASLGAERDWPEQELVHLRLVAQIIGNVLARQQAELREAQVRRELQHAARIASLGELAAALAHELNQPLTAILSNAQAARRLISGGGFDPVEIHAILDDIVRDDKRAGDVLHSLRRMVGKQAAERETCDLNGVIIEVDRLLHAELLSHRLELRCDLAHGLASVEAVRVELQQVLVNLFLNAVHAMRDTAPERRYIEVETRAVAGGVELNIRDRGHGLPADGAATIFNPFVSTKPNGLGIGLPVCRRIVEGLAGRIGARNHAEGGAVFTVWLPVAARAGA
jgi:signal transduction histidine kinase